MFEQYQLPFASNALEPHFDALTMDYLVPPRWTIWCRHDGLSGTTKKARLARPPAKLQGGEKKEKFFQKKFIFRLT